MRGRRMCMRRNVTRGPAAPPSTLGAFAGMFTGMALGLWILVPVFRRWPALAGEPLEAFARVAGTRVRYVKPHGALYNTIVTHEEQAAAVVQAVVAYDRDLPVLGLPGSAWLRLADEAGLTTVAEAFADREYTPEGTLVSRRLPGAVLHDADEIARRCVAMATGEPVTDVEGGLLRLSPESICVHGDTPGAVAIARRVREALTAAGVPLAPFAG